MRKIAFLLLILAFSNSFCFSQSANNPQILILSPKDVTFDAALKKEVELKNVELVKMAEQARSAVAGQQKPNDRQLANIKLMQQSSIDYLSHIDVFKQVSLFAQQYLTYRFFEKFPNCLILLKDNESKSTIADLQKTADEIQMAYILNFPRISLYKKDGQTYCKLKLQLYYRKSNSLLLDKEYIGDWNNQGFEFTCDDKSIGCTLNNCLAKAMPEVIVQVASNDPTLIKEKEIAEKRADFIKTNIFQRSFNPELINEVIKSNQLSVNQVDLYQCLYNSDNTKFVGLFIKTLKENEAKGMLDEKQDNSVKVITSKDIHDPNYLNQKPKTYAYIFKGIKYNNKWYVEKSEVTYFDSANLKEGQIEYLNNLQDWTFFKDNSFEPDPEFWEGKLFNKITDKRKDPDWEKYKTVWEDEERENRDYIGLYELVATELKKENETVNNAFRENIITAMLVPFYANLVSRKAYGFFKFDKLENYNIIYPKDKHVILNPVKVTAENGDQSVRFFIVLPQTNEIFEWTYVKPYTLEKNEYTDEPITKTIRRLTNWTFASKTLDDVSFWNDKVLLKEGNDYKYLKRLP